MEPYHHRNPAREADGSMATSIQLRRSTPSLRAGQGKGAHCRSLKRSQCLRSLQSGAQRRWLALRSRATGGLLAKL